MISGPDRFAAARDPLGRPVVVLGPRARRAWQLATGAGALALAVLVARETWGALAGGPREALGYLAIGFAIGLVTCIPVGVANVTVIDTVYRHGLARAIAVGLGGALADGIYASVGIFGVARLLARHPAVPYVLYAISGAVLIIYGVALVRAPPVTIVESAAHAGPRERRLGRGLLVGLAATLLNPSAIVTWVVIVGSYTVGVSRAGGAAWVAGIVLGSFAWFVVVALLALYGKRALRSRAIWMTRLVGLTVIGYGLISLGRAVRYAVP